MLNIIVIVNRRNIVKYSTIKIEDLCFKIGNLNKYCLSYIHLYIIYIFSLNSIHSQFANHTSLQ